MSDTSTDGAIEAVVFDFGGVLITPITNQIGAVARAHDVDVGVMKEVLLGPSLSGDHPWHRAERGEIEVAEIQPALDPWAAAAGVELNGDEIERLLAVGQYTVIGPMLDRVDALRAGGVRTGLLTNTFAEFQPTMQRDIDLTRFDVVIESFAVGARKPEPQVYAATESALGVAGGTIMFLDDFVQNLEPARALGWQTLHVTDPLAAIAALDVALRWERN